MSDVDDYIRDNASTMSREEIVTHLHAAGYNLKEIDAAWRRSRGFPSCAPTSPAPARRVLGLPRLAFGILAALAVVFIAVGVLGLLPFDVAPLAWAAFPYVGVGILAIVARSLIRFARGDRRAFRGHWVWLNTAGLTAWLVRGGQADWLDPTNPYMARGMLGAALAAFLGLMLIASLYWASVALGWIGTAALLLGIGLVLVAAVGLLRVGPDSWGGRAWLPTLMLAGLATLGMALIWIALSRTFPR